MLVGPFLLLVSLAQGETCRALTIEGGGSHGAYEMGALYEISKKLSAEEISYNVVVGVSTGSINAVGIAQYPKEETAKAAEAMYNLWNDMEGDSDIFKEWPEGIALSVIFGPSIYNTAPLKKYLRSHITLGTHRNISVGATDMNTGKFHTFNETLGFPTIIEAVMCSADPPFFFPSQFFHNTNWADGGLVINQDVFTAVSRCLEVVDREEDITLDMLFDGWVYPLGKDTNFLTLGVFSRVQDIERWDKKKWYDYKAMRAYPNVNYRINLWPSGPLPVSFKVPLNFDHDSLVKSLKLGQSDALNALKNITDARNSMKRYHDAILASAPTILIQD